ncbi:flavodoxin domain-containing protein [Thermobifida halotolerans]|uniref:Flavodoxin domain-containing protein n=1 Tax=Thermobifida halotolerans TaxID=483545 RepID=A0A399FXR8_9ACTN|nr:flavodoxin domain-containing protein [Thermobifida halotolerans]UOE18884.1 flavodoxin domain-containing protein [Thermobifida halotolerans]
MLVMIGYASAHGSTEGIARRVADRLREHGHDVDVRPLDEPVADLDRYDAFVLGSAVHGSSWLREAVDFTRRETDTLAQRPVWLFSVGLARVLGGRFEQAGGEPRGTPELRQAVGAREHRLLAGAIQPKHLPLFARGIYRMMGGRYGDFRDWAEVDDWAESIAAQLTVVAH